MSKRLKIAFIIALALILIGIIIFVGVMCMLKWDFRKLSTSKFIENTYQATEGFSNISLNTKTADIIFVPSENGEVKVISFENEKIKHAVEVKDGTLKIDFNDTRKWYEHIGINFYTPKLTVYIPAGQLGNLKINSSTGDIEIPKEFTFDSIEISESTGTVKCYASALNSIKIKTSTGNIFVENVNAANIGLCVSTGKITVNNATCSENIQLEVSTGKTKLNKVRCQNLISSGSTGDILLDDVIATEKFSIERSTGDVELRNCDAAEIYIKTTTGDIEGSVLSEKFFMAHSDTGDVEVPKTTNGGKCEINTDTGDIEIEYSWRTYAS